MHGTLNNIEIVWPNEIASLIPLDVFSWLMWSFRLICFVLHPYGKRLPKNDISLWGGPGLLINNLKCVLKEHAQRVAEVRAPGCWPLQAPAAAGWKQARGNILKYNCLSTAKVLPSAPNSETNCGCGPLRFSSRKWSSSITCRMRNPMDRPLSGQKYVRSQTFNSIFLSIGQSDRVFHRDGTVRNPWDRHRFRPLELGPSRSIC